jgi:uncharacterized protein (DUF885 family)
MAPVELPVPARRRPARAWAAAGLLLALLVPAGAGSPALAAAGAPPSPALAALVDRFLVQFQRRHPSIAAGNGLHAGDAGLENFSAAAIADEVRELEALRRDLRALEGRTLTPDEAVDRRILDGVIGGWLLDLTVVRSWQRNPMVYAVAIADGVHNLMVMTNAPPAERLRRVTAKLRGVPTLLAAARTNIVRPPRVFAERGITFLEGAAGLLDRDLWLAFADVGDPALLAEARGAASTAGAAITAYVAQLRAGLAAGVDAPWAVGADAVAARYREEELLDLPLDRLVAIGERELAREQARFTALAARLDATRPPDSVWAEVRRRHPPRGGLVAATQQTVDELTAFVRARGIATVPDGERVTVAPSLPFDLGFASMHASPPLESPPLTSFFYITDVQPGADSATAEAWLERFSRPSIAILSAHEAMPGHWLHALYMRETPSRLRRIWIGLNPFPQPSSGQDGWAHYAEQLVVDEGFHADDPAYALAQSSEALTRICRLLAGIRLHRGDWTLEAATAFFAREAHLPPPAARREAVRGTYDPTYGVYFLGKRALLALKRDVAARDGAGFDARRFHERLLRQGIAPWWAHRQLLLPGDTRPIVD